MPFLRKYRAIVFPAAIFGAVYGYCMVIKPLFTLPFDRVLDVWQSWQSLNAGVLALLGATLVLYVHHRTEEAQREYQVQENRRRFAVVLSPLELFIERLMLEAIARDVSDNPKDSNDFSVYRKMKELEGLISVLRSEFKNSDIMEIESCLVLVLHYIDEISYNCGSHISVYAQLLLVKRYLQELISKGVYISPNYRRIDLHNFSHESFREVLEKQSSW